MIYLRNDKGFKLKNNILFKITYENLRKFE